jgi:hypothetical protein
MNRREDPTHNPDSAIPDMALYAKTVPMGAAIGSPNAGSMFTKTDQKFGGKAAAALGSWIRDNLCNKP